ncbi:glycosyltransferase family 4 protein [Sphingomonas crocodyli]|uniref:Glycosyltransferase family 1 protein n=1 Tax=Sphingomonas crocodyli TaxID=1979270 RepID=A0A437MBE2_9SPHN|nr:glycosyltransferase family 1 protein [Sphingomonas crocodyli]RVT94945.1 glycosyltransferase family 1 protein [Sphingomonas crocodyli]
MSVDALSSQLTGIGRYCLELVRGLPGDDRVSQVSYFRGITWLADPAILLHGGEPKIPRKKWRRSWDRWWNYGRFADALVHAPNYFLPPWAERGIATVHDLSVFKYPQTHPPERVRAFEAHFADTVKRAGLILTDCEWVRREVIDFTGLPETRVRAVPLGVSPAYHPREGNELVSVIAGMGLTAGGYGLCVSTFEPRKRINTLLLAWRNLPLETRSRTPLVLAGASGWGNDALMAQIDQGQREGWLIHIGFVPEERLPLLYAGAKLFAYPSQYEGFGLPPLEAMASGVPTIVAGGTCLEEVGGGVAISINPEDIPEFSNTIRLLLEDQNLHERLSIDGIRHSAGFDWPGCVRHTIDAYQVLVG